MKTQQGKGNKSSSSKNAQPKPSTKERGLNEDEQKQRVNQESDDDVVESEDHTENEEGDVEQGKDSQNPKDKPFSTPSSKERREVGQVSNSPKSR